MHETTQESILYRQYQESGGIIDAKAYKNALTRARNATTVSGKTLVKQAELMAKFADIELHHTKNIIDPRIILYGILRTDSKPEETKYHHSQMSDQRLFAEVLRILGDMDALNQLMAAHHKIGTYCPICLKVILSSEKCR